MTRKEMIRITIQDTYAAACRFRRNHPTMEIRKVYLSHIGTVRLEAQAQSGKLWTYELIEDEQGKPLFEAV